MIQELLGGGNAPNGGGGLLSERKISIPFSSPSQTCPSSTPILTTTAPTNTTTTTSLANSNSNSNSHPNSPNNTTNTENNTNQQNLRCPRCDSTNTKFCYYNNYNLTQPRHFCKTCRRYWTKGGTLRNVPIGGGCRKNKTTTGSGGSSATSGFAKSSSSNAMAKAKATLSTELLVNGNPGFLGSGLLDHLHHHSDIQQNPILWPSLQQNSHILSLLRGSPQFPNPSNPNPNTLGLDSYGNGAPSTLLGSSYQRNNQHQQGNGFLSGVQEYVQHNNNNNNTNNNNNNSSNILELYQRLKSSSNYNYCGQENQGTVIFGNMMGTTTSSPSSPMHTNILDSAPVVGGDHNNYGGYAFMNSPALSGWSDFPTVPINGAFP